ncbi:MAG: hypothetical protein DME60_00050 [Verrucomicrobia bacterium]|nr:MAG: hypothetical protein DME60_00050 [Verrucomicrobiota bacterium]
MKHRFPEVVSGSAGILPAAAGMLPAAFCNILAHKLPGNIPWLVPRIGSRLSGNMPDRAGNMPALPRKIVNLLRHPNFS